MLAACGRLGFEETEPPPDGDLRPSICEPADVGTVTLIGTPIELRVVPLQNEIAVLIGTDAANIYAVRVTTAPLAIASVHLPLEDGYALTGGGAIGGNVFVYTDNGADAYLKRLDPSWDTYGTMQSGTAGAVD